MPSGLLLPARLDVAGSTPKQLSESLSALIHQVHQPPVLRLVPLQPAGAPAATEPTNTKSEVKKRGKGLAAADAFHLDVPTRLTRQNSEESLASFYSASDSSTMDSPQRPTQPSPSPEGRLLGYPKEHR